MGVSLGQSHLQPPGSLGVLLGCLLLLASAPGQHVPLLTCPHALGSFCLNLPALNHPGDLTHWTEHGELVGPESLQESLEGISRGQGLLCWAGIAGASPGRCRAGGSGRAQSRATARECQMLLGCELGSCESRSVQSHLERGERRGGALPQAQSGRF